MNISHIENMEIARKLWNQALETSIYFNYDKTIAGAVKATEWYFRLGNYRKTITKNKLKIMKTKEFLAIRSCRLIRTSKFSFALLPVQGRQSRYIKYLENFTENHFKRLRENGYNI